MKRSLYLAGIVALGFASLLLWRTAHFVRTAEMEMKSRSAQLESVLNHADEAAQESVHVSRDTRINLVHFDRNQQRIAQELDGLIVGTNRTLNGEVLPQAAAAIVQFRQAGSSLTLRANELAPVIEHADMAMLSVDDLTASPQLRELISNLDQSSAHGAHILSNGQAISDEAYQAIYEMRHPAKRTRGQRVLDFVLRNLIGNAIQGAVRR